MAIDMAYVGVKVWEEGIKVLLEILDEPTLVTVAGCLCSSLPSTIGFNPYMEIIRHVLLASLERLSRTFQG